MRNTGYTRHRHRHQLNFTAWAVGREQARSSPFFSCPPPQWGGLDLDGDNSGCAHLGGSKVPPLGVVKEEVVDIVVLVRRHRRAVGTAVRRSVGDEVPGAVGEGIGLPTEGGGAKKNMTCGLAI